jgi:hypothetical protein
MDVATGYGESPNIVHWQQVCYNRIAGLHQLDGRKKGDPQMERRFTALRVIATVFKILAWIVLILGLIAAIGALFAGFALQGQGLLGLDVGGPLTGVAMFLVALIIAIFNFMLYYAIGESIYLFLSIEESARRTAYFLQQQSAPKQTAYAPTVSMPGYSD